MYSSTKTNIFAKILHFFFAKCLHFSHILRTFAAENFKNMEL